MGPPAPRRPHAAPRADTPPPFLIERPPLHGYAAVAHPGLEVETYGSDAGEMLSHGGMHRISINRTGHRRYAFRLGEAGPTHSVARPPFTLGFQPAGLPLHVDGDAAAYISIFQDPETYRRAAPESFRPEEFDARALLVAADPVTLHLALALAETTRAPLAADPLLAEQLGLAFAVSVMRLLGGGTGRAERVDRQPPWLARVTDHVEARLEDGALTLADLAAVAGLSPWHFARAFRAATGTAPHRYVVERRVALSIRLMARRDLTLAEIAYAAGFSSQAHFSTLFRRVTGRTPGEHRRAM